MKKNSYKTYIILWCALLAVVLVIWCVGCVSGDDNSTSVSYAPAPTESPTQAPSKTPVPEATANPTETPTHSPSALQVAERKEMVGVWVPFMALTTAEKTETAFKQNFDNIVKTSKAKGVNTLFVHVRPYCDALYKSSVYPWSHILTGEQGKDPGYDPLQYMVQAAHENGMQIHAWINPLRVKTDKTPETLSADNPYTELSAEYPYYFMQLNGAVYLNPAYPYVRGLIADGATEIVENYDIDGIHFDDYFYPSTDASLDSESYASYTETTELPVPLEVWREANINAMVSEVYEKIKRVDPDMVFGISPAGNINNNYNIGADVKTWCAVEGYIDYICPQLYYSFENPALGYSDALLEWQTLPMHDDLDMYIGLALYKAGTDADDGTWLLSDDIIKRQIELARMMDCSGVVLYSSEYLEKEETAKEVENAMAAIMP